MSRDDVGKVLGAWIDKGDRLNGSPPEDLSGRNAKGHAAANDGFAQLNFKLPQSMKSRIKQLAARDSITLLAMLYHMVDLYESEHGSLSSK